MAESQLGPILSQSMAFTSRVPEGSHCQRASEMIEGCGNLNMEEKEVCRSALRYLQIGLDAISAKKEDGNRYQMICTWMMLITPEFAGLLLARRPEAWWCLHTTLKCCIVVGYYGKWAMLANTSLC